MGEQQRDAVVRALVAKYARMQTNGRPGVCGRSNEPHVRKLVIFDSREAAQGFADEFSAALGGRRQTPFLCARSKHGHFHLRSSGP